MVSPGANIFPHSYQNENECLDVGEYKTTAFAAEFVSSRGDCLQRGLVKNNTRHK